jgi:hypothetical protein
MGGGVAGRARWSRPRFWDASATLGPFLDAMPPRALVVTSNFQTIFMLWYLQSAEARRPDVTVVHRHFLAYPGYEDEILRRHPELAPLVSAHDVSADKLLARGDARVEYDVDLDQRLIPGSVLVSVRLPPPADTWEPQTRRYAAWQAFLGAQRACRLGEGDASAALQRARVIVGMPALNCDQALDPGTIVSP